MALVKDETETFSLLFTTIGELTVKFLEKATIPARQSISTFLCVCACVGHSNSTVDVNLLGCIQTNGTVYLKLCNAILSISNIYNMHYTESLSWIRVNGSEVCREHDVIFIPTKVHLTSKNDIFVTGNGMMYRFVPQTFKV